MIDTLFNHTYPNKLFVAYDTRHWGDVKLVFQAACTVDEKGNWLSRRVYCKLSLGVTPEQIAYFVYQWSEEIGKAYFNEDKYSTYSSSFLHKNVLPIAPRQNPARTIVKEFQVDWRGAL